MSESISEYEQERREKLSRLRGLGVDPYGQRTEGVQPLAEVRKQYTPEMGHDAGPSVTIAGRVMFLKRFGKLAFATLRDETGDLQIALDKKRLNEADFAAQELLDLGDQIVVTGKLGTTKTGEITIWATAFSFAAKALLPPPGKWHGLEDVEQRYRQRYVDLWTNPEVMKLAKLRIQVIQEIRNYLIGQGYVEVETPMMQVQAGGAAAKPFVTHHNALDIPLYMRIAPELYLKRLLVGGFRKVFEINRNFRNEGISPRHNPEFTMLEAYEAFGSWETMADMVEGLICHVAEKVFGTLKIVHPPLIPSPGTPGEGQGGGTQRIINLQRPWRRVRMTELVADATACIGCRWDFDGRPVQDAVPEFFATFSEFWGCGRHILLYDEPGKHPDEGGQSLNVRSNPDDFAAGGKIKDRLVTMEPGEQLQYIYEKLIEPTLIDPTFVTHIPSVIIPLAKENKDDPYFADVYELAINGVEISPGYTELNDPDVQATHFAHQVGDKDEQQKTDTDFLSALKYGMPPAGGMGLGVDRLIMMLTGAASIRDVILFPLMKPV